VDALLKRSEEQKQQQELSQEEAENLKKSCRGIFITESGILVARAMMKVSGIYKLQKNTNNPMEMGAERGKEFMYLHFIKGMLEPEQLMKIERNK